MISIKLDPRSKCTKCKPLTHYFSKKVLKGKIRVLFKFLGLSRVHAIMMVQEKCKWKMNVNVNLCGMFSSSTWGSMNTLWISIMLQLLYQNGLHNSNIHPIVKYEQSLFISHLVHCDALKYCCWCRHGQEKVKKYNTTTTTTTTSRGFVEISSFEKLLQIQ